MWRSMHIFHTQYDQPIIYMIRKIVNSKILERTKRFLGRSSGIYLKLKRFTPSASEELRTATILKNNYIDLVIDIGANTGQFAESLYDFGYDKDVISFEPIPTCHELLLKRSQKYKNWRIADRCAIGEKNGHVDLNISQDTVFSSILKMKEWHSKLKPVSNAVRTEQVPVHQLDDILSTYVDDISNRRILLKIDTQGYEEQVLAGASNLLEQIVGIKIEIPLAPIYENVGFTFFKTIRFLEEHNFQPYSFNNEGVNLKTGRVNTIDGLFLRE